MDQYRATTGDTVTVIRELPFRAIGYPEEAVVIMLNADGEELAVPKREFLGGHTHIWKVPEIDDLYMHSGGQLYRVKGTQSEAGNVLRVSLAGVHDNPFALTSMTAQDFQKDMTPFNIQTGQLWAKGTKVYAVTDATNSTVYISHSSLSDSIVVSKLAFIQNYTHVTL